MHLTQIINCAASKKLVLERYLSAFVRALNAWSTLYSHYVIEHKYTFFHLFFNMGMYLVCYFITLEFGIHIFVYNIPVFNWKSIIVLHVMFIIMFPIPRFLFPFSPFMFVRTVSVPLN